MIDGRVTLSTPRLALEPLAVAHADELAGVLGDPRLYEFTGGSPPTVDDLRARYARQIVGRSADASQTWLNWVLRDRATGVAVGTVQATVSRRAGTAACSGGVDGDGATAAEVATADEVAAVVVVAEVAWVIGVEHQRQGYAREGAVEMVTWLRDNGCDVVVAHIHPDHEGSMAVALALGLHPTAVVVDGEVRWESRA